MKITLEHARTALLHAQGLTGRQHKVKKADLLDTIRRIGVLQIDTISVVNRSPWCQDGRWLSAELADRFCWPSVSCSSIGHAACFLPIEDFGQYRRFMLDRRVPDSEVNAWASNRIPAGTIGEDPQAYPREQRGSLGGFRAQ
ncbi:MAG: hypothetical protein HND48_13940 [Chloroflexi bacterium]|nr:hypothetical protein [Chloroflexota bacterium]